MGQPYQGREYSREGILSRWLDDTANNLAYQLKDTYRQWVMKFIEDVGFMPEEGDIDKWVYEKAPQDKINQAIIAWFHKSTGMFCIANRLRDMVQMVNDKEIKSLYHKKYNQRKVDDEQQAKRFAG